MSSPSFIWISRFLRKPENAFLCVVDDSFIRDRFNLNGLGELVPNYELARQTVLDEIDIGRLSSIGRISKAKAAASAELFYGLVHARFVLTPSGIDKMFRKYKAGCFGYCPRINCERWQVLPIGLSDTPGQSMVRLYCPRCMDVYTPPAGTIGSSMDGAYFGTSFPQMMIMTLPENKPPRPEGRYVARIHGFRVHKSATDLPTLVTNECIGLQSSSQSVNDNEKTTMNIIPKNVEQ